MITFYDYDNQAWVKDGRYQMCGHPRIDCGCFTRQHENEKITTDVITRAYDRGVINFNEMMQIIELRSKEAA